MPTVKFAPSNVTARPVYSNTDIKSIFEEHAESKYFYLTVKLGTGGNPRQTVNIRFKNFNHKKCLKSILQFAVLMWKLEYCKPYKPEESKWMKKRKN